MASEEKCWIPGGGQFGEEDILRTFNQLAAYHGGAAQRGLPEGEIEHMMQAKGNQGALDDSVQPGTRIAGGAHQIAQHVNP